MMTSFFMTVTTFFTQTQDLRPFRTLMKMHTCIGKSNVKYAQIR